MTREERLFYAIGGVEDRLLEDCEELFSRPVTVRRKKWPLLPAACLCAALAAGLLLRFYQPFWAENDLEGIAQDEAAGSACSSSSIGGSSYNEGDCPVIPWEELSIAEQYTTLTIEGQEYTTRRTEISQKQLGLPLGEEPLTGWDPVTFEEHSTLAKIYALKDINQACGVAVEFSQEPGRYWVYGALDYHPESLGQLMENMDLERQMTFGVLRYEEKLPLGQTRTVEVECPDNDLIWDLLRQQADAPAITNYDQWILRRGGQDIGMEISVDLPLFGVENLSMTFTRDGWLTTNILGHGTAFYLGEIRMEELLEQIKGLEGSMESSFTEQDGEAVPSRPPQR